MNHNEILVVGNIARDKIMGKNYFGGSASIIALNLRHLGILTGIFSVIGNDDFSKQYVELLQQEKVSLENVSESLTELPLCEVSSSENSSSARRWIDNGCRVALENLDVRLGEIENQCNLMHLVGCPPKLVEKFIDTKIDISYDPGPRVLQDDSYINKSILNKSSYLFANDEEMASIQRILKIDDISRILENYPLKVVIVTRGQAGSDLYFKFGEAIQFCHIESYNVESIDPTGAGDAYRVGFLCGVSNGHSFIESAKYGSYLAALIVTQKGGIATMENIERFNKFIYGNII